MNIEEFRANVLSTTSLALLLDVLSKIPRPLTQGRLALKGLQVRQGLLNLLGQRTLQHSLLTQPSKPRKKRPQSSHLRSVVEDEAPWEWSPYLGFLRKLVQTSVLTVAQVKQVETRAVIDGRQALRWPSTMFGKVQGAWGTWKTPPFPSDQSYLVELCGAVNPNGSTHRLTNAFGDPKQSWHTWRMLHNQPKVMYMRRPR